MAKRQFRSDDSPKAEAEREIALRSRSIAALRDSFGAKQITHVVVAYPATSNHAIEGGHASVAARFGDAGGGMMEGDANEGGFRCASTRPVEFRCIEVR
ncbi:hypothetical protein PVW46_20605 [Mameliella sp. AT18]|uniref:hypothetical protein n=1 Tax=Mameliella sp. AT18 TaxID=3028385 RepID=UPI00237BE175|nr:hypothetical protein [Mameliella sp. AT18]MDD9732308.1 hypothetical protein [Mameliella sp. AT18]